MFFVIMSFVPLAGSLITEPAAMTLAALLLRDGYYRRPGQDGFKYMTLGVLFVNVSIGGVLTAYAAPPVLMVASTFNWDTAYMATHFGWRAALAVCINAGVLTFICRKHLLDGSLGKGEDDPASRRPPVPWIVIAIHTLFLVGVVLSAHHPIVFLAFLMLFIGYAHAYQHHQNPLLIREGLMVGFFLSVLVEIGRASCRERV